MKSHSFKILLFTGIVFSFYSCDGDAVVVNSQGEHQITIHGFISDEEGQSVEGASIQLGTYKATSNGEGYFELPNARCAPEVYIQVNKQGYFTGSRMLSLEHSKSAYVRVSLIQKKFSNSFQSSSGAVLDIESKVKLVFPPQAIANQNGSTYNGNVQIAVKYLDPTSSLTGEMMPGALIGLDANGELRALGSYAMAAIELQSPSGSSLQIKTGKEVSIKFEIPKALLASTPANIPLWYYDEKKGIWKEEGSAMRIGNYYEGKVKHFSFWNCDISLPLIQLNGRLVSQNGNALDHVLIKLTMLSNNLTRSALTNEDGLFEGRVPKDEVFNMQIFHGCGQLLSEQKIGPFTVNTNLGDLAISTDLSTLQILRGTLVDSKQQPLKSVVIDIKSESGQYINSTQTNDKGDFTSYSRLFCAFDSILVTVTDLCGVEVLHQAVDLSNSNGNMGRITISNGNFETRIIRGKLFDTNSNLLNDTKVQLTSGSKTVYQTTDQNAEFEFLLPICNVPEWALSVIDRCENLIFVRNISLNNTEGDMGSLIVPSGSFEFIAIDGQIIDCRNNGLGNISITIKSGERTFHTISNDEGKYSFNVPFCDQNSITITAYDPVNYVYSNSLSYTLPGPVHVLPLQICKENTLEFLSVQFSDGTTISEKYNLEVEDIFGELHIFTNTKDPWFELKWEGAGSVSKVTPISEITYFKSNSQYIAKYYNQDNAYILFTNVARSTGEYYQGVFEGIDIKKIDISTGKELAAKIKASGSFKIKRGW